MAETLASIGKALGPEEFTSYVLNGLGDDYDNMVENINGRDTPIQPRELYARLLAMEQRIQARRSTPTFQAANAATRGKGKPSPAGGKPSVAPAPRNTTTSASGRV
ncbi:putative receptor protein kinase ZmPK1 [Hordeum vulgare]|nr:putative receptor protein kinase ZmPK1 [Hordeum vulgare]